MVNSSGQQCQDYAQTNKENLTGAMWEEEHQLPKVRRGGLQPAGLVSSQNYDNSFEQGHDHGALRDWKIPGVSQAACDFRRPVRPPLNRQAAGVASVPSTSASSSFSFSLTLAPASQASGSSLSSAMFFFLCSLSLDLSYLANEFHDIGIRTESELQAFASDTKRQNRTLELLYGEKKITYSELSIIREGLEDW